MFNSTIQKNVCYDIQYQGAQTYRYLIILEILKIWVFFQFIEVLENDQKILEYTGFQFSR